MPSAKTIIKTTPYHKDTEATIDKKLDVLRSKIKAQKNKIISKEVQKALKKKHYIHENDIRFFTPLYSEYALDYTDFLKSKRNGEWLLNQLVKLHAQTIDPKSILYFASIDVKVDNFLGKEHFTPDDVLFYPYDHGGVKIIIQVLPAISTFYDKLKKIENEKPELKFESNSITDSQYLSKVIAKDLFLEPEQVIIDFKLRTPADAIKRKIDIKMKSIKGGFKYLKENINSDNIDKEDWLVLKQTIADEYVDLIKKFEGDEKSELYQNMLKMFNDYNVKVEKKEANNDEPRKDK